MTPGNGKALGGRIPPEGGATDVRGLGASASIMTQIIRPFFMPGFGAFTGASQSFDFSRVIQSRSGLLRHLKVRIFNAGTNVRTVWITLLRNKSAIPFMTTNSGNTSNDVLMAMPGVHFKEDYWIDMPFYPSDGALSVNAVIDTADSNVYVSVAIMGYTVDNAPLALIGITG